MRGVSRVMRILDRLKKSSFIRGIVSIGIGNIVGQAITIIALPILSRIYSPEAYGEYGIVVSLTTIFTSFITLGLNSAIMEPKENRESRIILKSAIIIQCLLITILMIFTIIIQDRYKLFNVSGSYSLGVIAMYVYAFFTNLTSVLYTYVNRLQKNGILLINPIIKSVCILLIAFPLGFLHFNYLGFMLAYILAEVISSFQMVLRVGLFRVDEKFSIKDFWNIIKKYRRYIFYQCPANAIGTLGAQLPTQFLASIFNHTTLGNFTMCNKVISMPISVVAKPISNIYFRTISEYQREKKDISDFTLKIVVCGLAIGVIPMSIVILWGGPIFAFVLGKQWVDAGEIASYVGVQYVLMFIAQCISYCRVAIGRQGINLFFSIFDVIVTLVVCFCGIAIDGTFISTIILLTIGKSFVYFVDIVLDFVCMRRNVIAAIGLLLFYIFYAVVLILCSH